MNLVIETNRLMLRTFTIDDASLVYELNADPEVTRYTHDPIASVDHAREVLERSILPQYALYNHGRWAVITKSDRLFIGWCGLKFRPELQEVDLGYRFCRRSWGNGYATEAAYSCINYGFEKLQLREITGRAEPGNRASVRVLEKCGMIFRRKEMVEGCELLTYALSNPFIR